MTINWLERARQKISETSTRTTAFTADRYLNAVNAVPHPRGFEKSGPSNPSIRSKRSGSPTRVPKNDGVCVRNENQLVGSLPLLRIEDDAWVEFEERAAILEFDGGYSREEAERLAQVELGISTDEEDQ